MEKRIESIFEQKGVFMMKKKVLIINNDLIFCKETKYAMQNETTDPTTPLQPAMLLKSYLRCPSALSSWLTYGQ